MNVIIRIINTGEVLDLFPKVALENTITSAFLSEDGSKAIPISLPITDKNTRIFAFTKRIDRARKGNKELDIIITKGSYSRKGKLYLSSSSNNEWSYSATIAYNEAILYDLQSKLKLTALPNLPVKVKELGELLAEMQDLLVIDDPHNPLTIFKVELKELGTYTSPDPIMGEREKIAPFTLNNWTQRGNDTAKLEVKTSILYPYDNEPLTIKAARGIGISPFVHVWYVIERIAEHYGYTMGENQLKEDPQLLRLTLLNNTADAIVGGFIDYKQLMPDVTISEFFQFLWARFGARIFIDGNTNTMNIKLVKNAINEKNISRLPISGLLNIEHAAPKQLKLTAAKNLENSSTETDSYEEFCTKYNNTIGNYWDDAYQEGIGGIMLDPSRGLYYHIPMAKPSDDNNQAFFKPISSVHFDWDKKDEGLEYTEISSPDECLTASWENDDGRTIYYGLDFALRNSTMELNRKMEQRDEANKLAVCWDMGQYYYPKANGDRGVEQGWKFGSIFPDLPAFGGAKYYYIDKDGIKFKYALTWIGKDGCFEHFWKEYDAVLRHSGDAVKGKINLQPFELSSLDISKPYIVDNQKILLQDYSYIIGNVDVERQEFNAITLGLYLPYDLEKEQSHPRPDPILYKWALVTTKQKELDTELKKVIDGFVETPLIKFVSCEWIEPIIDSSPPNMDGLAYYPPSKKDVEDGRKIGQSTHYMKATYLLKWKVWIEDNSTGEGSGSYWKDMELSNTLDLDYKAYFVGANR